MCLFAYGIDPHLDRLLEKLHGILLYSAPTLGPTLQDQAPLPPTEERYKVTGYADDCKPAITSMAEFKLVEHETRLFERASGSQLHCDLHQEKVKFLPLGRWRGQLTQEDLPMECRYIKISDHLDMLGAELYVSFFKTKQNSGKKLVRKFSDVSGPWRMRFMPLTQRPWSVNSYLLPKAYFRCHLIPLRKGDISAMKKSINAFVFSDQYEKPTDLAKYCPKLQGGLGLHHIESKALAMQIKTFIELAISTIFQQSLFYTAAYNFYVLETTDFDPGLPPTVTKEAISIIKAAILDNLEVETVSAKQWYNRLLEKDVLQETILEPDGTMSSAAIKTKSELEHPQYDWNCIWWRARMPGLTNDQRSFFFKFFHNLLPSQERQMRTCRNVDSPNCLLCNADAVDSVWHHAFTSCSHTDEAMTWMVQFLSSLDPATTNQRAIWLQFDTLNPASELAAVWLTASTLSYSWSRRKKKEPIILEALKSSIRTEASFLSASRHHSNTGVLLLELLDNKP